MLTKPCGIHTTHDQDLSSSLLSHFVIAGKTPEFNNYGGVAEWLKAADCKSARVAYVGSNPTPTTIISLKAGHPAGSCT